VSKKEGEQARERKSKNIKRNLKDKSGGEGRMEKKMGSEKVPKKRRHVAGTRLSLLKTSQRQVPSPGGPPNQKKLGQGRIPTENTGKRRREKKPHRTGRNKGSNEQGEKTGQASEETKRQRLLLGRNLSGLRKNQLEGRQRIRSEK